MDAGRPDDTSGPRPKRGPASVTSFDLEAWAAPRRGLIEDALAGLFSDAWPGRFGEMGRYPLLTGGKRMRPLLVFGAFEAVSPGQTGLAALAPALAPALAVELIHCYSLVHDDLPCMDDDDVRRGEPTTHVLYGEANALLVGDALLTEAFRQLSEGDSPLDGATRLRLVAELARAAGYHGMIGGQAADVGVGGPVEDVETLTRLHRGKTGALIRFSVRAGAIAAGADADTLERLTRFADAVGLAFQVADDLLDLEQDAGPDGPPNFPRLIGVEATRAKARALAEEALAAADGLARPDVLLALARFTVDRPI